MRYVIALGSNAGSDDVFDVALRELKDMGNIAMSSVVVGKDYTNKTDLIYHNAVMMMTLCHPLPYDEFNELLKMIEIKCGRPYQDNKNDKHVPMDLDILAYCESAHDNNAWQVIKKRLPFKAHEKKGLREVAPFLLSDMT